MNRTRHPWATLLVTFAGAGLMATAQAAPAQGTSEDANRTAIAERFNAWRNGSGSPYDILADDAKWTIAGNSLASKTYPSKEAFLGEVVQPFNARMQSRLIPTVRRLYADGDTVVAHFDAEGTARDGGPYRNSYAWILRMDGGKIVEATAFFDAVAFDDFWRRVTPAP